MNKFFRIAVVACSSIVIASMVLAPAADAKVKKPVLKKKKATYHISISAIPGADERDFSDTASRCLTKSMIALNAQTVKQMEADIAAYGVDHPSAAADYREKIAIVWSAMEQPYCGFGSMGMTAVRHSFIKSVDHIRQAFLTAAKHPGKG